MSSIPPPNHQYPATPVWPSENDLKDRFSNEPRRSQGPEKSETWSYPIREGARHPVHKDRHTKRRATVDQNSEYFEEPAAAESSQQPPRSSDRHGKHRSHHSKGEQRAQQPPLNTDKPHPSSISWESQFVHALDKGGESIASLRRQYAQIRNRRGEHIEEILKKLERYLDLRSGLRDIAHKMDEDSLTRADLLERTIPNFDRENAEPVKDVVNMCAAWDDKYKKFGQRKSSRSQAEEGSQVSDADLRDMAAFAREKSSEYADREKEAQALRSLAESVLLSMQALNADIAKDMVETPTSMMPWEPLRLLDLTDLPDDSFTAQIQESWDMSDAEAKSMVESLYAAGFKSRFLKELGSDIERYIKEKKPEFKKYLGECFNREYGWVIETDILEPDALDNFRKLMKALQETPPSEKRLPTSGDLTQAARRWEETRKWVKREKEKVYEVLMDERDRIMEAVDPASENPRREKRKSADDADERKRRIEECEAFANNLLLAALINLDNDTWDPVDFNTSRERGKHCALLALLQADISKARRESNAAPPEGARRHT